jgi:hypothetical protein
LRTLCGSHLWQESHFQERYQLLTLIFLGEVVTAGSVATAEATEQYLLAASAIVTACIAFSLIFLAKPADRRNPWELGVLPSIHTPHAHLAMFLALPALGAAFARIVEHSGHGGVGEGSGEEPHEVHVDLEEGEEDEGMVSRTSVRSHAQPHATRGPSPSPPLAARLRSSRPQVHMLFLSAGIFLIGSAVVNWLGADGPSAEPRCSSGSRAVARSSTGLLLGLLALTDCNPNVAASIVPAILALLTLVELWAVQPRPVAAPLKTSIQEDSEAARQGD